MYDPIQRIKRLPWKYLFLTALITNLGIALLEFLLGNAFVYSDAVRNAVLLLFTPPLAVIVEIAIGLGVGALAVYYLETIYPRVIINAGVLWALLFCVMVIIFLKSFISPVNLVNLGQAQLAGLIVGVFVKGKRYWR